MTGVPDGTYWFRAESDPDDDFVESDESNNETDVLVTIANGEVTPGARRQPDTTPCRASLEGVRDGDRLTGTVPLSASTSAGAPDRVSYLLDGTVVGSSSGPAPYTVDWDATAAVDGRHWLAARVRTAAGAVCTSPVLAIDVDAGSGPDTTGPQVRFTDPEAGGTVGGRVAVAVSAADASGVDRVQLLADGQPLGGALTDPPYSLVWDTRAVSPGPHRLTARATDRLGNSTVEDLDVTVVYSPPPKPIGLDASVVARGHDRLTTPSFSTRYRREVLLALVSYDGPPGADQQGATVTGAGLTWRLVKRSSSQSGSSEVWAAATTPRLQGRVVRAVPRAGWLRRDAQRAELPQRRRDRRRVGRGRAERGAGLLRARGAGGLDGGRGGQRLGPRGGPRPGLRAGAAPAVAGRPGGQHVLGAVPDRADHGRASRHDPGHGAHGGPVELRRRRGRGPTVTGG